jgi:hypothetical protein
MIAFGLVGLGPFLLVAIGMVQTKTVYIDRETCKFRVTESWLGVTRSESFRESWVTGLIDDGSQPDWEPVLTRHGSRISGWHGVTGSFWANLNLVSALHDLGYLSDTSLERVASHVLLMLQAESGPIDALWTTDRWLECFNERFVYPSETGALVDDEEIERLLEACSNP